MSPLPTPEPEEYSELPEASSSELAVTIFHELPEVPANLRVDAGCGKGMQEQGMPAAGAHELSTCGHSYGYEPQR